MAQDIRDYVSPEYDRQISNRRELRIPPAIRAFAWFCFARSGVDFLFALLVGLAPQSGLAIFVAATFGDRIPYVPAEAEFFIFSFLFAFVGWKWMTRDWRIRWFVMFMSGAFAARILVLMLADTASAAHGKILGPRAELELSLIVAFNLLICFYLAFYPGIADVFKETP
ncbi:MAG: hypothetical protein WBQ95_18640 [Terracidiphilus sp.]